MCGIAGIFSTSRASAGVSTEVLTAFSESIATRGPDAEGAWVAPKQNYGCVHRRLSIIDVDRRSDQPMHSPDGRYTLCFNGEIYNYRELRDRLRLLGHVFVTDGDTEVLLHMYMEYGVSMLNELRGMYAFTIYDQRSETLILARDPLGIKPLYYATGEGNFYFASRSRSLLRSPGVDLSESPAGHVGFFVWGSVPEPYTLYRGIHCLPSGTFMIVSGEHEWKPTRFCEPVKEFLHYETEQLPKSQAEGHDRLHEALEQSVHAHLTSDVPVALFLSAGVDSCAIAALASETDVHLEALTLAFDRTQDTTLDEIPLAARVAELYDIHHQPAYIDQSTFFSQRDRIFEQMDQPTIDGVNTYFISWLAKKCGFKVALSGLGGDELFGGYPSFRQIPATVRACRFANRFPAAGRGFRVVSSALIRRLTSPKYAGLLEYGGTYGGAYLMRRGLYMPWELTDFMDPELVREGWRELASVERMNSLIKPLQGIQPTKIAEFLRVSALEMSYYMRTQLLRDADWAGMAHSVEIRVPMADMTLLRQIAPLRASTFSPRKPTFLEVLRKPLPAEILNRPKTGFVVPIRDWLMEGQAPSGERGLRSWAKHIYTAVQHPQ